MRPPRLTAAIVESAFEELANLARAESKVIDVALYGGAALLLVSNFREATFDVDAVASDDNQIDLERFAGVVATRRGWQADWLNDQVFPFLSDKAEGVSAHHELFRNYPSAGAPGLRVYVPTVEYMCALKLIALRIDASGDAKDLDDLVHLTALLALDTPEAALALVRQYFDGQSASARVATGIKRLYELIHARANDPAAPPVYLGRGRRPA